MATHGSVNTTDGEGHDRHSVGLPGKQAGLAQVVLKAGKPTVIILVGGGSIGFEVNQSRVAVMAAGFGGERGGEALAAVLFGDESPSGRLTATAYNQKWQALCGTSCMNNMSMTAGPGRSYRYLRDPTLQVSLWMHYVLDIYLMIKENGLHSEYSDSPILLSGLGICKRHHLHYLFSPICVSDRMSWRRYTPRTWARGPLHAGAECAEYRQVGRR